MNQITNYDQFPLIRKIWHFMDLQNFSQPIYVVTGCHAIEIKLVILQYTINAENFAVCNFRGQATDQDFRI